MPIIFNKEHLYDGIDFFSIVDKRFKTNLISIWIVDRLSEENAPCNALSMSFISKSNKKYPDMTLLNKKLSSLYGANLSGTTSKVGDNQFMMLGVSCIADKYALDSEKLTLESTDILMDCLLEPNVENNGFSEKLFTPIKQELLDDIDAIINDKRSYALMKTSKIAMKGEPSAIRSCGEREYAEKVDSVSAYKKYNELLKTSEMKVFFVGSESPDEVKSKIKERLSVIERNFGGVTSSEFSPAKSEPVYETELLDVMQSKMVMSFKCSDKNSHAVRLMTAIFGATPFSKLFVNVREKMSLCYYCAARYDEIKGILNVDSGVEQENIEKARNEILNQLESMKKGEFTDEEMNNSLLSLINAAKSMNDSAASLASWYLKQDILGTNYSPEEEIERLKSVTREDIIKAASSLTLDTVYVLTKKGDE